MDVWIQHSCLFLFFFFSFLLLCNLVHNGNHAWHAVVYIFNHVWFEACRSVNDFPAKYDPRFHYDYGLIFSAAYMNSTRISPTGASITACPKKCVRDQFRMGHISWSQMSIATTITAETHVIIIDKKTNSTRTSTVYNTHASDIPFPRPETNSAGTAIATVISMDGNKTSFRTV